MPYADPASANNRLEDAVGAATARHGDGKWREILTATVRHRSVLLHWPPGSSDPMHVHPEGEEIFVIHEGRAEFDFGEGDRRTVGPGSVLYAPTGQAHAIKVVGDEALLMMCFMSINEPDDTTDVPV
ncbi:MAG TPA: cupin domain-containing protein [Chloroflexota bacterium]|jgi:quercetin dioxygenase-like cupin family protein|nr:cupin domain-containing protein [Chloroflexota bacterium]